LIVGYLEITVAALEPRPERQRRLVLVEQDRFLEELQQHLVQAAELHDRTVVALHELLDRQREARVLVAEHLRELHLMIEQQPVLAPAREQMQPETDAPEKRAPLREDAQLALGQELVRHELGERARAQVPLREPADHLNVAQAPGAALDVGFEVVGRVVIARVARALLLELGAEERGTVPHAIRADASRQLREQTARAVQQARFHERRNHGDVAARLALAVVERAHAVADLETDVPKEREKSADRLVRLVGGALDENEQVDVRLRVELATRSAESSAPAAK